jgi:tetratricopeptide (TPR) repeat protein
MPRLHLPTTLFFCMAGSLLLPPVHADAQSVGQVTEASLVAPPATPAQGAIASSAGGMASLPPEMQGDLLMNRGSYAAAIRAYESVSPRSASVWNKTGIAYHHLFALGEALKDYQMAIHIDPAFAPAYNNLGAIYHARQQFSLAEKAYKNAIKYRPWLAVSYCNLGTTYFAEAKDELGKESYRKALQLDPDVFGPTQVNVIEDGSPRQPRVASAYNLAKVYASAGRNEEALASLHKALAAGFRDRRHLLRDKEFASLRETPEFRQLLVEEHLE